MATIEFKNVSFSYPNSEEAALENVSFAINESEFVVVCGSSGSGKTTLLRHMKKNMIPYGRGTGDILYNGQDIESLPDRLSVSEIGYVQQNPENQIVTDKVWHEMAFGLESLGLSNEVIRKKTAEMAEYFGISGWFKKNVWELSGGQKQLLNLASVMVMQPKVLILDEPTAQLDPIAAIQFIDTIEKINRDFGTTIILSEHRLEEVFPVADRVLAMENGKIAVFDTPEKTGRRIAEEKSSLYYGLPSAMKIYSGINEWMNTGNTALEKCPITVKEGRIWLDRLCEGKQGTEAGKVGDSLGTADIAVPDRVQLGSAESTGSHFAQSGSVESTGSYPTSDSRISFRQSKNVLEMKNVYFRYERKSEDVLGGVSFKAEKGELLALLGANGVGKTTILKILAGIKKPYSGKVFSQGKIIALPQNPQAVFTEITVEEELAQAFYNKSDDSASRDEKIARIEEMLIFMGLQKYRKTNPYDLSGGQQQKLAIGKVLLLDPQILLLDEPTKGIDPYFKRSLARTFKELTDRGVTIVMVSHDIEFCAKYATKCALLFDGTIVSEGKTREFFGGNTFYTTAANRMSRHIFKNCVTCEQVIEACKALKESVEGGQDEKKL